MTLTTESNAYYVQLIVSAVAAHSQSPPQSGRSEMGDPSSPPYTCGLNGKRANTSNGAIWEEFVKSLSGSPILKQAYPLIWRTSTSNFQKGLNF